MAAKFRFAPYQRKSWFGSTDLKAIFACRTLEFASCFNIERVMLCLKR